MSKLHKNLGNAQDMRFQLFHISISSMDMHFSLSQILFIAGNMHTALLLCALWHGYCVASR
jgi:hypothetical protein